ncbi:ABC transporter ATP-binding protein/permease [SAR86 cluster bacterium]|nr:ABC transporter ATP-binding protein/permease [SAR86 cluster bacterium]
MTINETKNRFYPIYYFLRAYPKRSIFTVFAFLFSGLAEVVSFAAMIPLLGMAMFQNTGENDPTILESGIAKIFDIFGLDMTMGGILLLIVLLMTLKSLLSFYAMKEVGYICADVEVDLRKRMVNSLLYANWRYYLNNQTGDFSTAISTQVQNACNVFRATGLVLAGVIQVGLFSAMSLTISIPITLGGIILGIIVMFILRNFVTLARVSSKTLAKHEGTLLSTLIDGLRGIKSNKAMGLQDRLQKYLDKDIEKLADMRKKIVLSSSVLKNFAEPVQITGIAIALYILSSYWNGGFEELLVLIMLFYRTGQRLGNLQIYYQQIFTAIPPFWFVMNIINNAKKEREDLKSGDEPSLNQSIVFNRVSFAYDDKNVLDKVDLNIKAGDFITIIGPSGGGKTTLTDMLLRFNKPDSGTIEIDGKNINHLNKAQLRNMIGYVPQETILFHDTVRNNLTFGDIKISDKKLEEVLQRAGALNFVEQLPNGLDFNVGEHGGRLSGGQKQRLGLARALLHTPKILLLDEPTSALDKKSENDILNTLNDLRGTVTIIAISHQETFVNASDIKYSLENGKLRY